MQYTQEITLELNSNTAYTTVGAKQGDNNSRIIKIHITENGSDYVIPEGYTSFFRFRKPDGKAIVNSASISEDRKTITVVLTAQTLAVAGRGYADVVLQSGSNVLSTVSFIIIIMAAPSVGDEMASSNEFGYLSEVVTSATDTIYAAEAWAAGTRGGQQLIGQNSFTWDLSQAVGISQIAITESTFMGVVGSKPGLERSFTFTFVTNTNGNYWLLDEIDNDGITSTTYDQVIVNNIGNYGIVIQTGTPANEDKIIVTVQQADPAYNNNAKYYTELLQNLTVSATSTTGEVAVTKTTVDNHYNFEFAIPKGDTGDPAAIETVSASVVGLSSDTDPTVSASISGDPGSAHLHFDFGIPMSASVNTVDGVGADSSRNIPLGAVRYNASQTLTVNEKRQAQSNIGGIGTLASTPVLGQFLKYVGNQNSFPLWATAEVDTTIASYSITSSALDTGAVTSRAISSGAIHSIALAFGAVVRDAIAQYAVGTSALDTHSVTANALAPFAVTSSALSSGAVTSNAIASSAVTSYAIASGCIESWHFSQSLWGDSRLYGSGS